jgi:hypothetical protein
VREETMRIRLTVEADDPEVAGLLEYLETNVKNTKRGEWIALLERAIQWMRPAAHLYGVSNGGVNLAVASLSATRLQIESQSPPESLAVSEVETPS